MDPRAIASKIVIAYEGPTGAGKSIVAVAVGALAGLKTLYVVSTLQLQQQLARDFPRAIIIWGREHYECSRFPGLTANDCTHRRHSPCPKLAQCPYRIQKALALAADLVVVNYSYFLVEANRVGRFSGWPLLILDEADLAEHELLKFVSLTLTRHQLEACQISPPEYKTKPDAWLKWAQPTLAKVETQLHELEGRLDPFLEAEQEPPKSLMFELIHYQRLHAKLKTFTAWMDDAWVAELNSPEQWEFKPTRVQRFGHLLTGHSQRILAMSATMLNAKDWAENLGLGVANG